MARSPIEAMIDKACGHVPSAPSPQRETVTLHCPMCGQTKLALKAKTDPPGTVTIHAPCPKCVRDYYGESYYDAEGKQIIPE